MSFKINDRVKVIGTYGYTGSLLNKVGVITKRGGSSRAAKVAHFDDYVNEFMYIVKPNGARKGDRELRTEWFYESELQKTG